MTGGIGTRSEIVNGRYTGEIIGPFCYGSGKVVAIMELARDLGYDLSQSYSYSDAASDLPMLESTKYSFAVNPDAELEKIARERSYPIVRFSGMRVRSQSRFRYSPQKLWLAIGLCVSILAIGRKDTRKAAQVLLSRG
jgi:phosphoserine phosphatase